MQPWADEITMSAPFLRALVALSASKPTRSQGADTVISSAPRKTTIRDTSDASKAPELIPEYALGNPAVDVLVSAQREVSRCRHAGTSAYTP
jgi:hypothetical protein